MTDDKNDASEFVLKLQDMLENYKDIVDWNQDETEIIVKDLKKVTDEVLPKYFRHRKFESFVRQLNMYNFYKVCRQKNNTISFKNDFFFKGNQTNFSKIKRKRKNDFKTKSSDLLEQNLSFIRNHPNVDLQNKAIFEDLLNLKNVTTHSNKKLDCLLGKLVPEMKATKFKKYDCSLNALKASSKQLDKKSEQIQSLFNEIKSLNITQLPIPDCQRAIPTNIGLYQRSLDLALSQTNICSTLIQHCDQRRYGAQVSNNNICFEIQTFLSITKFLGVGQAKIPTIAKLQIEEDNPQQIVSHPSRTSIENEIQTN